MCECFQFQLQDPDFLIITDLNTLSNFFIITGDIVVDL